MASDVTVAIGPGGVLDYQKLQLTGTGRLKAENSSVPFSTPQDLFVYQINDLMDGASSDMNVNGSVTPVNFDVAPPAGQTWYLEELVAYLSDPGSLTATKFMDLAALANGVELRIRSNGTEHTLTNIKTNIGLALSFSTGVGPVPSGTSFFNETDLFYGALGFQVPATLKGSTGDYIRCRIQDNLTGLTSFRIRAKSWRVTA